MTFATNESLTKFTVKLTISSNEVKKNVITKEKLKIHGRKAIFTQNKHFLRCSLHHTHMSLSFSLF